MWLASIVLVLCVHTGRWPDFRTKSPPWPQNHTKTADPDIRTTHVGNGLEIALDSLENTLVPNKNADI